MRLHMSDIENLLLCRPPANLLRYERHAAVVADFASETRRSRLHPLLLLWTRISMKVLDMKYSGLVYVWGGLEGR